MTDNQESNNNPAPETPDTSQVNQETVDTNRANALYPPANPETPAENSEEPSGEEQETGGEDEDLLFEKPKDEEDSDSEDDESAEGDKGEEEDSDEKEDEESDEDGDEESEDADENNNVINVEELSIPDNMPIPKELETDFKSFAEEMSDPKLSAQEKMQKGIDLHVKVQQHSLDVWNKTKKDWREETLSDESIGGDNWSNSQKAADHAIRQIWANPNHGGSEELLNEFQDDLKMLGLGNKKSFIKGMINLSKMIGEDAQGDSQSLKSGGELSMAEKLYGKDGKGRK